MQKTDGPILIPDESILHASKELVYAYLTAPNLEAHVAHDAVWHVSHPVNQLQGRESIATQWVTPLNKALRGLGRRIDIFMGGAFDGRFCGGEGIWVAVHGYYVGEFVAPLFGLEPTSQTLYLRYGEFYRVVGGQIAEARILIDVVDLCRQIKRPILPPSSGLELWVPGPADHGGCLLSPQPLARTLSSVTRVQAMIAALMRFDGVNLDTMGMHEHWSPTMMWYGPCGIGTARTVAGFQTHHQRPFLHAFPDRKGGSHRARIAEGHYLASTGWPSVTATHSGEYLGVSATNAPIGMRVMDWWRVSEHTIEENWVLIDLPHLMLQMGVDLLSRARR